MTKRILLLHGPNLNLLGLREPDIYGADTLADVEAASRNAGIDAGVEVVAQQSNHEGQLVTWIQEARETAHAIVLNAGAYTHTSVAIHDALRAFDGVIIELHISNPHLREKFRHWSYISPCADAIIAGFGVAAYPRAIRAAAKMVN
ncbi:MAG: type II 3-dehydroquinate dehydratase [Pikeienuella sp.]